MRSSLVKSIATGGLLTLLGCASEPKATIDSVLQDTPSADLTNPTKAAAIFALSNPGGMRATFHSDATGLLQTGLASLAAAGCPAVTDLSSGDTVDTTYVGGCAESQLRQNAIDVVTWEGEVHALGTTENVVWTFSDFTRGDVIACTPSTEGAETKNFEQTTTYDGEITHIYDGDTTTQYQYRFIQTINTVDPDADCEAVTHVTGYDLDYSIIGSGGLVQLGGYVPTNDVRYNDLSLSGSGRIADYRFGTWDVEYDELQYSWAAQDVINDAVTPPVTTAANCTEPLAGTVTAIARGHEAKLFADGTSECSVSACADWELDGELQEGQVCSFSATGCRLGAELRTAGYASFTVLYAVLYAVLLNRRRALKTNAAR